MFKTLTAVDNKSITACCLQLIKQDDEIHSGKFLMKGWMQT